MRRSQLLLIALPIILVAGAGTYAGFCNTALAQSYSVCGVEVPPDDPEPVMSSVPVATAQAQYGFTLPLTSALPTGYSLEPNAAVEADPWDGGWSVLVTYDNPSNPALRGIVSMQITDANFFTSAFGGPSGDPSQHINSNEVTWQLTNGEWRIIWVDDPAITFTDTLTMACSMPSYPDPTGFCP